MAKSKQKALSKKLFRNDDEELKERKEYKGRAHAKDLKFPPVGHPEHKKAMGSSKKITRMFGL